jgi:hypothetical protein
MRRPVYEKRLEEMRLADVSRDTMGHLEGKFGEDLVVVVGTDSVEVIKCCPTASFGVLSGLSEADVSKALSGARSFTRW